MSERTRVLLVGMGSTTESALKGLLKEFKVVGLVRQAEAGDPALKLAERTGVPVVDDISISAVRAAIERTSPDCVAVSSYHLILPADVVNSRPFVNVHYAPLPRYRGRATVNWAIINGESHTAITVHELLPALDAGGILYQEMVPIGPRHTVTDLYRLLNSIQELALPKAILKLLSGDHGQPQDESLASYTCTRVPGDGEIDWSRSVEEIDRLVRALTEPFPGAFTWLGEERIGVSRAVPVGDIYFEGAIPGRVASVNHEAGDVRVLTGSGVLQLQEITVQGHSIRPAALIKSTSRTLGFDSRATRHPPA